MSLLDYDWREKVASMTEADDQDIEKAFSDMASGFVTNRVGDLMKDEHRIGFEIVKKNDDNTRMLGIFAFKIDKNLIFAPVFFLSGEIKGPLLYRCDNKRFVPANKDWAAYLIEHMDELLGRPILKSKSRLSESRVQMDRILEHPTKEASIKAAVEEEFGQDIYTGMAKAIIKQADTRILKEFLTEPDFGEPAARLIEKVASMENSDAFVLRLAQQYGSPENFLPEKFTYTEKQAAAEPRKLELVYEFDKLAAAKVDQYWKDGFYLFDNRYLEDTCKVYIQDEADDYLDSVADTGIYDILKEDGELERGCTCMHLPDNFVTKSDSDRYPYRKLKSDNRIILIIKDNKIKCVNSALGIRKLDKDKCEELAGGTTVNEGSAYIAYTMCQDSAAGAYHIMSKKTVDGVTYCKVVEIGAHNLCDGHYYIDKFDGIKYTELTINPDLETSDASKHTYGKDAKFIRISTSKVKDFGSDNYQRWKIDEIEDIDIDHKHDTWVYDKFNLPTLSITFNKSASYPYLIHDKLEKTASEGLTRKEMLIKLAKDMMLPADTAYELTAKAENDGCVNFLYDGIDKLATRIRIVGRPDWREGETTDSGLPKQNDQRFVLSIAGDQNTHEVPHIGDALNPTTATGLPNLTVVSTDPEQLRGLADTYLLPNVFEHGIVGTLADTFDANRLMDKYLPKLHEALDAIGRTLFLFYWKPDDFERQYGLDDMTNLEAQLESEFESFGALTLNLAKKNDKQKAIIVEPGDIGV